jgi:ATP-dependent Clp protease ATP-binding subunit ClpA
MADRFDDQARRAMELANGEAHRLHHEYVGTEHILLGLVNEGSGVAAEVLRRLNVDPAGVRGQVERILGPGPEDPIDIGRRPHTPRAKRAIEYAIAEARAQGHDSVGTEHLLVGLARAEEGVAAQILLNFGLRLDDIRAELPREVARRAAWLAANGGAAEQVARGLAETRRWAGLPVLADALQEAGCDDVELLAHLRRGADHGCTGPGCWALDRLLRTIAKPPTPPTARPWWHIWG